MVVELVAPEEACAAVADDVGLSDLHTNVSLVDL